MSKDKKTKPIRVPINCPRCLGTGFMLISYDGGVPESVCCNRCHGTGNVGYTERTQAEIDETEHKRKGA